MGLIDRQCTFAYEIALLIMKIHDDGYGVRFGDAWRSTDPLAMPNNTAKLSYQELLLFNGKTKVKYGKHNDRLAIDLLISKDNVQISEEDYRKYGEYWEARGGVWGGSVRWLASISPPAREKRGRRHRANPVGAARGRALGRQRCRR